MDTNHPEYESFLNDVASKVRGLKDPFDAFASLFLRIFSGAIGPAKAFGQIVATLYKTTVLKNGQVSTVQIVVHPKPPGYHYNDLTFSPGELVLRTSTADQVQWRIVGGGRECEVQFVRSPFRPPDTVIRSGMVVTVDPSAVETCYKYTLKSVDGTPYTWPPGGNCPEIIIQR